MIDIKEAMNSEIVTMEDLEKVIVSFIGRKIFSEVFNNRDFQLIRSNTSSGSNRDGDLLHEEYVFFDSQANGNVRYGMVMVEFGVLSASEYPRVDRLLTGIGEIFLKSFKTPSTKYSNRIFHKIDPLKNHIDVKNLLVVFFESLKYLDKEGIRRFNPSLVTQALSALKKPFKGGRRV